MREETSLWDNLLQRYLCPVSRLYRLVSLGLVIIAPSRGVESPVPTGVYTLAWTAADISTDFFLVCIHIDGRFRPSFE